MLTRLPNSVRVEQLDASNHAVSFACDCEGRVTQNGKYLSCDRLPAFMVAAYSFLLLAPLQLTASSEAINPCVQPNGSATDRGPPVWTC